MFCMVLDGLRRFLEKISTPTPARQPATPPSAAVRLGFESLENRQLLSASPMALNSSPSVPVVSVGDSSFLVSNASDLSESFRFDQSFGFYAMPITPADLANAGVGMVDLPKDVTSPTLAAVTISTSTGTMPGFVVRLDLPEGRNPGNAPQSVAVKVDPSAPVLDLSKSFGAMRISSESSEEFNTVHTPTPVECLRNDVYVPRRELDVRPLQLPSETEIGLTGLPGATLALVPTVIGVSNVDRLATSATNTTPLGDFSGFALNALNPLPGYDREISTDQAEVSNRFVVPMVQRPFVSPDRPTNPWQTVRLELPWRAGNVVLRFQPPPVSETASTNGP